MEPILSINNLSKLYPGVVALNDVSVSFESGEVHALMGENGAGKSTLIKSIAGAISINGGSISINGNVITNMTPREAIENGIAVIYQEFNLVPSMSIAENIMLGEKVGGRFVTDFKKMHEISKDIFKKFDLEFNTKAMVYTLSTAQKQIVEIAKAISRNAKIIIMDEPSATLSTKEVENLFEIIRKLKKNGVTVIYISHRLDEVFEISERVTVLRDGKFIKTVYTANTNRKELVRLMVGRDLEETYPLENHLANEIVLEAVNITGNGVYNISFELKKGEILGLGGLVGAGRTELAKLIFGLAKIDTGELKVFGKPTNIRNPREAIESGIGLISEDRKIEGVFLDFPIDWNITIMDLPNLSKFTIMQKDQIDQVSSNYYNNLKIVAPSSKQLVKNLSGGNQQKVAVAKVLAANTKIIIFDEPTRGIDIGAKQEIYKLMNELTTKGISIIMISSDMEELLGMSNRIMVLHEGEISGFLNPKEFTQDRVLELASGLHN